MSTEGGSLEVFTDESVDDVSEVLRGRLTDLETVRALSRLLDQGLPKVVEAGTEVIDAGMLDHNVVRTLGQLGKAAVDSYHEASGGDIEPIGGLWGLMKITKDPEIQKLIGFGVSVAKSISRKVL